jgi:translocation and assembly module TamB
MSEGRVLFPFANFSVGTGRVRITQANPFTPSLDFRATTNTLGHDLAMSLTGAPDDPRLVFSSSPPLSSADILLLVMTGQSPDDGFAYTDQQRAFRLGTYLGQGILEQLLGLDMGEERLSLTSGDKVTRQGRETYKLEYKIDKRWTAVGEYDEFDDYNIGLKWRFYQSKPPKEKKNAP